MTTKNKAIVIGVPLKNGANTIRRAVESILLQENVTRDLIVFIANDNSQDNWKEQIIDFIDKSNVIIENVNFGTAHKTRNFINNYIREKIPQAEYVGRLDADDYLVDNFVISKIEQIIDSNNPDIILAGNKLSINNEIIERINRANPLLLENDFLKDKLFKMSNGIAEGELPSCNTFIKPSVLINYPEIESAEDHWFTVKLLLNKYKYKIFVSPDLLYSVYSLSGKSTLENRKKETYLESRIALYNFYLTEIGKPENIRIEKSIKLLKTNENKNYYYLGQGFSGVVFHDYKFVYKVHIPLNYNNYNEIDKLIYLKEKQNIFNNSKHFYEITDIFKIEDIYVLKYKYEPSEPITYLTENDYISFLTECWERKIICKSLTKENFIRVNGIIKLIDYEIEPFNDNLFLNMVARAFLQIHYLHLPKYEFSKLKRSAINNFNLPELKGLNKFLSLIFSNICFKNSDSVLSYYLEKNKQIQSFEDEEGIFQLFQTNKRDEISISFKSIKNLDTFSKKLVANNLFLNSFTFSNFNLNKNNCFEPEFITLKISPIIPPKKNVSLIIKTCGQDSNTIYESVEHIVKQLSSPNQFFEKILLIDNREPEQYLRQFNDNGLLQELYNKANQLITDKLIDRIVEIPKEKIVEVNHNWFAINSEHSHTFDNIPVTTQLYGFECAKADYILQIDSDVMIGRRDYSHSFLNDMISICEDNENVVTVAFGIPHNKVQKFQDYFGFENGGFVPEVRMCLIDKNRLYALRPLPNEIRKNGLGLSWYRSLEIKQKQTKFVSIRGGNTDSYFIHPQNYRKTDANVWFTILDRVEKGVLIESQIDEPDLQGSYYDWCSPKRNEKIIGIIIIEDNVPYEQFFRSFFSAISQKNVDFGLIIIDNKSISGFDNLIKNIIKPYKNITFIKNHLKQENTAIIYKAIHYYVNNDESIITFINPRDYILGNFVFDNIVNQFNNYNADVAIGKELYINEIYKNGLLDINFVNPRQSESNVCGNLFCFKKYLFDSLSIYELKEKCESNQNQSNFERLSKIYTWINDESLSSIIVPIIEMSKNPIRNDFFNYVIDSRTNDKECLIQRFEKLKQQNPKNLSNVTLGRKQFIPNQNKIEIDITYQCDLKCVGCNRSCTQAPSNEMMSVIQIQNFILESIKLNKKWELINILGGEPTMHPNFIEIVNIILFQYIDNFSPTTILQVTSNGLPSAKLIINELPTHKNLVLDKLSFKTSNKVEYFSPFNDAPIDNPKFENADYSKGCWVTAYCGIGLNSFGLYACSVIGGIDRVVGKNIGIKSLAEIDTIKLTNQLSEFCKYCGNYADYEINKGDFIPRCEKAPYNKNIISKTWQSIYESYQENKPILTRAYEE